MTITVAAFLASISATAGEEGRKPPTPEQKQFRKEMVEKYDTNKDGKLDKEERSKMSKEDREKMKKMRGGKGGKKAEDGNK